MNPINISVRNIRVEDAAAITSLSNQLGYPATIAMTIENIRAIRDHVDHDAFVAVYDEKVVGWTHVFSLLQIESPPFCEIRGLVVDKDHQRKGIGKLLVERTKAWGIQKGISRLRLRCNTKRSDAHLFYASLGFEELKEQKVFEINLEPAYH